MHRRNGDIKGLLVGVSIKIDNNRKRGILRDISQKRTVIIDRSEELFLANYTKVEVRTRVSRIKREC